MTNEFMIIDNNKQKEYAEQAKALWGDTPEYQEYKKRLEQDAPDQQKYNAARLMSIFKDFGALRTTDPKSDVTQELVKELQRFITAHYYTCSDEVLAGLGTMYAAGGDFTKNIDLAGGEGTAEFVHQAIQIYCQK